MLDGKWPGRVRGGARFQGAASLTLLTFDAVVDALDQIEAKAKATVPAENLRMSTARHPGESRLLIWCRAGAPPA